MKQTGKSKKLLAIALSLILALSFAPLFSVLLLPQAQAAVATNRNSSNFVYGHYYYYPAGTTFIKSIHVGYDKDKDTAKNNAKNAQNPYLLEQDWLDGMGSNIFKKYNYIYIAYGTTEDISEAWGTYIRMKHSSGTPATYSFNVNGQNVSFDLGSDVDFNEDRGSGSDYIYLYKTADPRFGLPITEFRSGDGTADTDKWESYFLTAERDNTGELSDFNRNAGGHYLWLHYGNYSKYTDVTTYVNALKAAIDEAGAVNEGECTAESYAALMSARNAALNIWNAYNFFDVENNVPNVYKCATYTVSQIQSATSALNSKLNALITRAYTVRFNGVGKTAGSMTDQRLPVNASRNLNANGFTREFNVTYVYNDATDGNSVEHDAAISQFTGWGLSQNGNVVYQDRQSVQGLTAVEDGVVDLYSNWTDSRIVLPSPTKEGYTFGGWYNEISCSSDSHRVGSAGDQYMPGTDVTLYARWDENIYQRIGYETGNGYTVQSVPQTTAKMTDTIYIKLKLDGAYYNCEPVVTCNTGTVTMVPYTANALIREYYITGVTEDYFITIGDAVPPTYTVTYVDGLTGETLKQITGVALGATVQTNGDLAAPDVDEYLEYTAAQHLKFTGWDIDPNSLQVNGNKTITSQYAPENHTWDLDEAHVTPATCQANGNEPYACRWCPATKNETIPGGAHSFTKKIVTDDYLKTAATCSAPAVYYYACASCDLKGDATYTDGAPLPHSLNKTDGQPATCTDGGWNDYWTCESCGWMFSDAEGTTRITAIPTTQAQGHALSRHAAEPATCTEPGVYQYFTCSRCPKIFSDQAGTNEITIEQTVQPATGAHNLSKTAATAVTCTTDGNIAYWTCSSCGQKFSDQNAENVVTDEEIVILHQGHKFTAHRAEARYLKSAATCTEAAVYYVSCENCTLRSSDTFTQGEPAGHDFYWVTDTPATCAADGVKHEKCRNCTETRNLNTVDPATGAHSYTMQTVKPEAKKSDATCTAPAVYYYSCAGCGRVEGNDARTFNNGSAKGHAFGDWVTDRAPSCTAEGAKHRTCVSCGYTENGTIDKASHTDNNGDYKCDDCGADVTPAGACPYCHKVHGGGFDALIGFFHRILYFFQNLFG